MRIEAKLKKYPGPEECGSIVWDSETGNLAGTLAAEIKEAAHEADARGWIPAGPQFSYELKVKDTLHKPGEFAALLYYLGYCALPDELAAEFKLPKFPDPLEGMSLDERRRTVF
jgi:hypothetical protein